MTAYRRMNHRDLERPEWDRAPPRDGPPARRVVICSTPRSGSYLLCRQMINAGMGVPHEYFHLASVQNLAARYGVPEDDTGAYIDGLEAHRTTGNGVFAAKVQWQQLMQFPRVRERLLMRADLIIYLFRTDIVAQAVSWQLSLATGLWSFDTTPGPRAPHIAIDRTDQTLALARQLAGQNRKWMDLLATVGRRVLRVPYEAYVRDQGALLRQIATEIALPDDAWTLPPPEARDNAWPEDLEQARKRLLEHARAARTTAAGA